MRKFFLIKVLRQGTRGFIRHIYRQRYRLDMLRIWSRMRAPCIFTMSVSPKPSPHRTSTFQHIRRSNSGWLPIFARTIPFGSEGLLPSRQVLSRPECLDPFPLCLAFPDALDGRYAVEYYGSAAPDEALASSPPIPRGSFIRFRRCSCSNFSVSRRYLSVILLTCEQAREVNPR